MQLGRYRELCGCARERNNAESSRFRAKSFTEISRERKFDDDRLPSSSSTAATRELDHEHTRSSAMKSIADPRLNLLTVLNVQSAKPSKRTSPASRDWHAVARKAAKRTASATPNSKAGRARQELAEQVVAAASNELEAEQAAARDANGSNGNASAAVEDDAQHSDDEDDDEAVAGSAATSSDPFIRHFGAESPLVNSLSAEALEEDKQKWRKGKGVAPGLGEALWSRPRESDVSGVGAEEAAKAMGVVRTGLGPLSTSWADNGIICSHLQYNPKLLAKMQGTSSDLPRFRICRISAKLTRHPTGSVPATQSDWLRMLSSYQDVLDSAVQVGSDEHDAIREATALHAMNHVAKSVVRTSLSSR